MRKLFYTAFTLISILSLKAQVPAFQWAKQFTSPTTEYALCITTDATGNVYTVGHFNATTDFDPTPIIYNLISSGFDDAFVSKLDMNGNFLWAKKWGSAGMDQCSSVCVDASGNVYTTGYFFGTVDFDPDAGVYNLTSAGQSDFFVSKLDAAGNFVWAKQIGGTATDYGAAIAIDLSGNVCLTGYFNATVDFDPGAGSFPLTASGANNAYVLKLDNSGNLVWAKCMSGNATGKAIAIDAAGDIYSAGNFNGIVDFDPAPPTMVNLTGTADVYISKLDAAGNFVFAKQIGGAGGDYCNSLALDASGNIYATGNFDGTSDFDPAAGSFNLTSFGGPADVFVLKLDASGNFTWARQLGGNAIGSDWGYGITVDIAGYVYVTGFFNGTADFNPGAAIFNLTSFGGVDAFICQLNASGNFVWAGQMGGSSTDFGTSITVNALGDVYTCGTFGATSDLNPYGGVYNLTAGGGNDVYICKLKHNSTRGAKVANQIEFLNEIEFLAFPNPVQKSLYIKSNIVSATNVPVRITNVLGETVMHLIMREETLVVDVEQLPKGIYFVSVNYGSGNTTFKIVKE